MIEQRLTIVGSFNYTAPAVHSDAEALQRKTADYALTEMDRSITQLAEPVWSGSDQRSTQVPPRCVFLVGGSS